MSKIGKVLLVFLIILLIIILGELFYILVITDKKPLKSESFKTKTGQPMHETTDTSLPEYKKIVETSERAIHPTVLDKLGKILKYPNDGGLYILQESTAKVLAVEPKGACVEDRRNGVLYPGEICFPFAIKLEDKFLPEGYVWIYFTETNIKNTKVYIKTKNGNVPTSLQKIQPNDVVFRVEKWDPSIPFDISKLKEYIDKQMIEHNIYIINRNL